MSPNDRISAPSIKKFDGENYPLWAFKMEMYLKGKGLWGVVAEDVPINEENKDKFQKAHSVIVLHLEDSQLLHVVHTKSAKQAWIMLASINDTQDMSTKMFLKEKFSAFKFESGTMKEHLQKYEELLVEMTVAGCAPEESDVVACLLRSLPSGYDALVQALRLSTVTVTKIIATRIIKNESVRMSTNPGSTGAVALTSAPEKPKFEKKSKAQMTCYNCGKKGHLKYECRSPKKEMKENEYGDSSYVALNTEVHGDNSWVIDSGASNHMGFDRQMFTKYKKLAVSRKVNTASSRSSLTIVGEGDVALTVWNGISYQMVVLTDCLHVDGLSKNLFSVPSAITKGASVIMNQSDCIISFNNQTIAMGNRVGNLYYLQTQIPEAMISEELEHRRMGHASSAPWSNCEVCNISKQTRKSFPKKSIQDNFVGLIQSDVMGPFEVASNSGMKFVVTFIVKDTKFISAYPMRYKDDVVEKFQEFYNRITAKTNIVIKRLRTDNGGEFKNKKMAAVCAKLKIAQEFTVPYNPEQNGLAERNNRTLIEMVRCMLKDSGMDKKYWAEAIKTAAYVRNCLPCDSNQGKSPMESTLDQKPDLESLRVFGCICYAHVPKQKRSKLSDTATKCRMLGYAENQKAYRVMDISNGNVFSSRSVTFMETDGMVNKFVKFNISESSSESSNRGVQPDKVDNNVDMGNGDVNKIMEDFETPSGSKATNITDTPRSQMDDMSDRHVNKRMAMPDFSLGDGTDVYCLVADTLDEQASSFDQIMKSTHRDQWLMAMKDEMKSITDQNTWELKPLPDGKKAIGSRWLFKIKRDSEGNIARFKARFCAKGFTQVAGIDFNETYAPVAKMNSIRTILSIVTTEDLELQQADVDTAFLYGIMDMDVYVAQPTGFIEPGKATWVCHLLKSLYGTKQAARQWYKKVNDTMTKNGFVECKSDSCVYTRIGKHEFSIVALYVDDVFIASRTMDGVRSILDMLKQDYSIKEMGNLHYYLGIKIERNRVNKQMFLSQQAYVDQVVTKFGLNDCKPCYTPAEVEQLVKSDGMSTVKYPYREAVGSMMYLMLCTRPDIANAVGCVAKYCESYDSTHWIAVKRILRYLKTTSNYSLVFTGNERSKLTCYADASWADDLDTRRSTTGYLFKLNGNLVSWKSQRQTTVALSSTEAEYMSLAAATQEAIWLKRFVNELKIYADEAVLIHQDNQGAIALAKNPVFHQRTKHIDLRYHFIREKIEEKKTEICYTPTSEMQADFLTKNLTRPLFEKHVRSIGLFQYHQGKVLDIDMKLSSIKK